MKKLISILFFLPFFVACNTTQKTAQKSQSQTAPTSDSKTSLFIDVHNLGPGKVTYEAVAQAHLKDLEAEKSRGVHFIKFWVNDEEGKVYCLSEAPNPQAIYNTHKEAHGLVPDNIYPVTSGEASKITANGKYFLDVHHLGTGNVTAKAVAEAHKKDLEVEGKHAVSFINYWVDEKEGLVMCLSKAENADSVINTHKEAHGLLPDEIYEVEQGE